LICFFGKFKFTKQQKLSLILFSTSKELDMKRNLIPLLIFFINFSCSDQKSTDIQTVSGKISADQMGLTLIHEHILVDFIGADSTGYHRWDRDSVIQRVLPFLEELKVRGVKTIVECTPSYLGKDPVLLNKLTELTGIRFLTNTGYYGAVGAKYLPEHAFDESAVLLANRWTKEFREGIENTGNQARIYQNLRQ
jgi:phosphotriesterase-related protein